MFPHVFSFGELVVIGVLSLLMFSPAEIGRFIGKARVWSVTLKSWAQGMWRGYTE